MSYLNHITISTGHTRRSPRAEVSASTTTALRPWLKICLAKDAAVPLPSSLGDSFTLSASIISGGLVCHVAHKTDGVMVTFGVAERSRQSGELWAWLCAQYGSRDALTAPETPWCAVALHPAYALHPSVSNWMGDFERCVAWTWIESKK